MPNTFNTLLVEAGLDPGDVRLLRHADPTSAPGRTPFHLWHGNRAKFDRYQSSQHMDERTRSKLKSKYWASFVGTPEGETLFVGVYGVRYLGLLPKDEPAPHHDGIDKAGTLDEYELVLDERLRDRIGQLYVDWGGGKKSWIQRADLQDKAVYEGSRGGIRSDSIVEGLLHEIETNGDLPKKANAESGWFAVVPRKWQDLMDRAAREGRDGPNLIVYRTTTNDPRDHHVIPFMVTRELLTDATAPIRADGSRRWEMTLKADQLRVTHGERVVDVSGYRGATLPGEVVGAAGEELGEELVAERAEDGSQPVDGDDLAVEVLGAVLDVFVGELPAEVARRAVSELDDRLAVGRDFGAVLADAGADAEDLEVDVDAIGDGLLVRVLEDDVAVEEGVR